MDKLLKKQMLGNACYSIHQPTIPQPLEYSVCKKLLDELLKVMRDLDLDHIFAHGEKQVYAWLVHIIRKDLQLYKNIDILMGRFHKLRAKQKTIYK